MGVLRICLCDVFMAYCVLSYGSCWCCRLLVRAGLHVFVRFACDLICDVVKCFSCALVCGVCLLFNVIGCRVCELLCDDACWIMCVIVFKCLFTVLVCFVCGSLCDVLLYVVVCSVVLCACVPFCF